MASATAIGLNVNEREVLDTPVIAGPPIGQSGCVFTSERGPTGIAVELNGLTFGKKVFGEPNVNFNSFFMLRGLFANAGEGGAKVFGSRVVAVQATLATAAQKTGANQTYDLEPGEDVNIDVDNQGPVQAVFDAAQAQNDFSGAVFDLNFSGGETLNFKVDGGATITVTFAADASTTLLEALGQINAVGTGFAAVDNSGQIRIQSDKRGTGSSIEIEAGTANTLLGASVGTSSGTGDVADIDFVTAAEVKTVLEADLSAEGLIVNIVGSAFQLESPTTGPTSELDIQAGSANTALGLTVEVINGLAPLGGGPTPADVTFNRSATPVWTFTAGYLGNQDPGVWANARIFIKLTASPSDPSKRDVEIFQQKPLESSQVRVELFEALDANNVVGRINNPFRGSQYAIVNIEGGDIGVPDVTAVSVDIGTTTPGSNGTADPTSTDYANALNTFDGLSTQIIANFDLDDSVWAGELETYCTTRGDVIGVGQTLRGATLAGLLAEFGSILKPKSFIALYRSYAKVSDALGGTIAVPVIGHVIGAGYVRKPRSVGNLPHIAPAGVQAFLLDVQDVEDSIIGPPDLLTLATTTNINPIVFESGNGFFPKTSRTMSTLSKHVSIHVRLLTNFIKVAFRTNLSVFEQQPNNITTRRQLRDSIITFMEDLNQKGAFETEGGFENNVSVVCDVGNNPQNIVQQRRLVCDTTFRPVEIAEDVQINLVQTRDGIQVSDT